MPMQKSQKMVLLSPKLFSNLFVASNIEIVNDRYVMMKYLKIAL